MFSLWRLPPVSGRSVRPTQRARGLENRRYNLSMSTQTSPQTPGTVSQILWHFTGGPTWDNVANRQSATRKSPATAYNALIGILETRELRVGAYKEVVKVRVAKVRSWDRKAKKFRTEHDVMQTLESAPVCCLADIPIMHLAYHAPRY